MTFLNTPSYEYNPDVASSPAATAGGEVPKKIPNPLLQTSSLRNQTNVVQPRKPLMLIHLPPMFTIIPTLCLATLTIKPLFHPLIQNNISKRPPKRSPR